MLSGLDIRFGYMNDFFQAIHHVESQLLMALGAFLLLSWPVVTGNVYTLSNLYSYHMACWLILFFLQYLRGCVNHSAH